MVPSLLNDGNSASATSTSNGNGTADGTGTVLGTPVPLSLVYDVEQKGDYLAAGVGMRGTGPPGSGTIAMPALPGGAVVTKSFLYWAVMEDGTPASLASGTINGNNIVGTLIGSTTEPCWDPLSPPPDFDIHAYVADVTGFEVTGGNNSLTNFASGGPPGDNTVPPILEGATLVVVYSDAAAPNKRIQIQEGAVTFVGGPSETTTFSGWTAVAGSSQTTWVVADGQQGGTFPAPNNRVLVDGTITADPALNGFGPGTQYWDTLTQSVTAFIPPADTAVTVEVESVTTDCITWVAQVLSVPVAEAGTPTPTPTNGVGGIVRVAADGDAPPSQAASSGGGLPIAVYVGIATVAGGSGLYLLRRLRAR